MLHTPKELIDLTASAFINSLGHKTGNVNVMQLVSGRSAASLYRLEIDSSFFVLRLLPQSAPHTVRTHQIKLASEAGKMGFGPKVHFVDRNMMAVVMEYIPGTTVQASDFKDAPMLGTFAQFLKQFHTSIGSYPIATSPFKRFDDFYLIAERKGRHYFAFSRS